MIIVIINYENVKRNLHYNFFVTGFVGNRLYVQKSYIRSQCLTFLVFVKKILSKYLIENTHKYSNQPVT